ncbi:DUF5719 family protein [Marinactinospora rubrisoli]|uniref:DUF5719 family protein n=1 Tax=Marinactinospora rubrisoli TaxID=2715399 RepID=A0ABW2KDZ6_9ACTN
MRLIVENRFALLALVMVALAALFGVAALTAPSAADRAAEERSGVVTRVESAVRACPAPRGGDGARSETAAFAPVGDGEDGGSLVAVRNEAAATPEGSDGAAGRPWNSAADDDRHTVLRADGGAAAGLEVVQTTVGHGDDPFATEVRCPEPSVSTWFTAPGGEELDDLRLFLANVDDTAATVNVDVYATDGPAFSDDTRGVTVAAHDELELPLNDLVEVTNAVAVHVRTSSGRVAASLFAERGDTGADWVPATTPPAERHVITGIPSGEADKQLIAATLGDDPATATVRVITDEGEVTDAVQRLEIPPAASSTLVIEGPLGRRPGTLVVESDRPVVVGVAYQRSGDTAYTAATPPLAGPLDGRAVVPATPDGTATQLVFGAPGRGGRVVVTPVSARGQQGTPQEVEIADGHTVAPELDLPGATRVLLVEVADGSGDVHAARVLRQGSGDGQATAVQPLWPAPSAVRLPSTSDSLISVVR